MIGRVNGACLCHSANNIVCKLALSLSVLSVPLPKGGRKWYPIGVTAYERIFEASVDSYGLITVAKAKEMGIRKDVLYKLVSRGRLERVGHGLYKLACPMPYSGDYAPYAQSVALIGPEAYLYGESVLAMLHLAPTNPKMMFVATAVRVRKKLEKGFVVLQNVPCSNVAYYEGVPSQTAADAIRSCFGTMMPDRLHQAINEGVRREFLEAGEARKLKRELDERNKKEA